MNLKYPKKVKIVEVGLRDGLQNEAETISLENKIKFAELLIDSGLHEIELGAFVHPKKVPQMNDSEDLIKAILSEQSRSSIGLSNTKFSALVPNMKGLERAIESGIKRISVFTAASETFTQRNINMTIKESVDTFKKVIDKALENNISVRGYVSTCFVCPYEGNVNKSKVSEVTKALLDLGVDEISLGDTIGAAAPNDVCDLLEILLKDLPKEKLALHLHDTYGTALANVLAGLSMGISTFDASAAGLGGCPYAPGASGNLATEDLAYMLKRMGVQTDLDLERLLKASSFIQGVLGRKLPSKNLQRIISASS